MYLLGIYVQAAIAQDCAFPVAPDDGVAEEAANPDQEADHILKREQPPLLLCDWVPQDVAGCGNCGGAAQGEREQDCRPCVMIRGEKQKRPGQGIRKYLSPVTCGTRTTRATRPAQPVSQVAHHSLAPDAVFDDVRGK